MFQILLLNGPNLNMLGTREPEIYGHETLMDIEKKCQMHAEKLGGAVTCFQSNCEGELISQVQQAVGKYDAIVINPAGYSHTSIALMDAFKAVNIPVYEVHLSNIHQREEYRHHSFISEVAKGVICGFGSQGYLFAIEAIAQEIKGA